jgi:hypothetical protein
MPEVLGYDDLQRGMILGDAGRLACPWYDGRGRRMSEAELQCGRLQRYAVMIGKGPKCLDFRPDLRRRTSVLRSCTGLRLRC